jgi:hypothetical protein
MAAGRGIGLAFSGFFSGFMIALFVQIPTEGSGPLLITAQAILAVSGVFLLTLYRRFREKDLKWGHFAVFSSAIGVGMVTCSVWGYFIHR